MAKTQVQLVGGNGAALTLAGGLVSLPTEALAKMGATEINPRGVVLINERQTFRVSQMTDADGHAAEFVVSVYVHRAPINADEADKIKAAANERETRKKNRTEEEQTRRDNEIRRAVEITESAITKGLETASRIEKPIDQQVASALKLAGELSRALGQAALPPAKS